MEELIKIHSPEFSEKEVNYIKDLINADIKKLKPIFNLKGFIFGPFYLLYKKAYIEALAVFIISLLVIQIGFILHSFLFLAIGTILPNFLVGYYFYFMYSNQIDRDIEHCGQPIDKNCLRQRGGKSFVGVAMALFFILFLTWPIIYGAITKQDVTTKTSEYSKKISDVLK